MNENKLVGRYISTGKEKYFSQLIAMYDKKLFNYIVRRIGNFESSKDVYQTVWMKIAASLKNYRDDNKFSNYLFYVATNACFDHLRKIKKDNENLFSDFVSEGSDSRSAVDNLRSDTHDPETENEIREESEMLSKAVDNLPDEQKDVILLRTKGLTFREIAEMKGISLNSILSRYRYAVEKLKKAL